MMKDHPRIRAPGQEKRCDGATRENFGVNSDEMAVRSPAGGVGGGLSVKLPRGTRGKGSGGGGRGSPTPGSLDAAGRRIIAHSRLTRFFLEGSESEKSLKDKKYAEKPPSAERKIQGNTANYFEQGEPDIFLRKDLTVCVSFLTIRQDIESFFHAVCDRCNREVFRETTILSYIFFNSSINQVPFFFTMFRMGVTAAVEGSMYSYTGGTPS
jgi:hypothetical protein